MNKFKKIGLTALAGSLVTMGSATAGEMSVSGSIGVTLGYGTLGGNSSRAIGSDRDVSFTGGGELDNGTTFSMNTLLDDVTLYLVQQQQSQHHHSVHSMLELVMVYSQVDMMRKFLKHTSKYLMVNKLWQT